MDSSEYTENVLGDQLNNRFAKIIDDTKKRNESKIQRCARKLKSKITKAEYSKLYPTGCNPGKIYGTAKTHKRSYKDTIDQLLLSPIVPNIGTASYDLSKYLAKLLSPLSKSELTELRTLKNSKTLFHWTVVECYFLLMCPLCLPAYCQISTQMLYYDEFTVKKPL